MSVSDIAVVAADVTAAAGLGWWCFGPKRAAHAAAVGGVQEVRVTVRGGDSPARIQVRAGVPVRLRFSRQESGDCMSRVVFPDLGVSADLPAFAETAVDLPPLVAGEYGFACGMNMIHGILTASSGARESAQPGTGPAVSEATAEAAVAAPVAGAGQQAVVVVDGGYLLYPFTGIVLSPMIAAAAMAASSLSVVTNATRLRRARVPGDPAAPDCRHLTGTLALPRLPAVRRGRATGRCGR